MATKTIRRDELVEQLRASILQLKEEIDAIKANPAALKVRRESKAGKPRDNMNYKVVGCFKAESKQPPQCLILSRWAWEAYQAVGRDLTEPELYGAFLTHEEEWKKRNTQPIWHVWQYYRPRMIAAGLVKMY